MLLSVKSQAVVSNADPVFSNVGSDTVIICVALITARATIPTPLEPTVVASTGAKVIGGVTGAIVGKEEGAYVGVGEMSLPMQLYCL